MATRAIDKRVKSIPDSSCQGLVSSCFVEFTSSRVVEQIKTLQVQKNAKTSRQACDLLPPRVMTGEITA